MYSMTAFLLAKTVCFGFFEGTLLVASPSKF
jgi:hypothetical protein